MRVRVGQTGPGLIDAGYSSGLAGGHDDNYEDEQQMSACQPSVRYRLPCVASAHTAGWARGSHTQLVLSARLCRMANIRSDHCQAPQSQSHMLHSRE